MSAGYSNPQLTTDAASRRIHVEFRLENRSGDTWSSASGFAIGWQIYDPETNMFICEGEWTSLPSDLSPGATADVALDVQLPPEKGSYHVYVSPRRESDGWFYQRGLEFILIEAHVEGASASVVQTSITTVRRLRRRNLWRNIGKVFTMPVLTVVRNRTLIDAMVRRDISARYRGSFGDMFWTVLNPLLLMATYFFVFGVVLQSKFPGDNSPGGFVLYFLAGMLPWLAMSESLGRAPYIIVEHRNFVKKLVFPVEILPVDIVVAGLVTATFALGLFLLLVYFVREQIPWTMVWLPVLIIPQILLTLGLSWALAALGVFLRDLAQVIGFVLTLWFFLTPICYPERSLPAAAMKILGKNPLYILVHGYRTVLLEYHAPEMHSLWKLWIFSIFVLLAGYACFHKLRKSFADVI